MRGVTASAGVGVELVEFQPALPMRGVTVLDVQKLVSGLISTRTPHAGSDLAPLVDGFRDLISTRTPHAGSDGSGTGGSGVH